MLLHVLVMMAGWLISFIRGAESAACPPGVVSVNLMTTADMQALTDAMNCSGPGMFNATLYNSVQISKRIEVSDEKIVHITGAGFPTIHGALPNSTASSSSVNAGSTTGIFLVSAGSALTIHALVLEGGHSEDGGAVTVLSSSSLHAVDCTFRNNTATTGGAIHADTSEVHIDGTSYFVNNSADIGGAMYAFGSTVGINGITSFYDNSVGGVRGSSCATESEAGVRDSSLCDFSEESYGGALSMDQSELYVDGDTYFANNYAAYGGAVHAHRSEVDVSGTSSFVGNLAIRYGGAMYLNYSEANIDGINSFYNNSAWRYGGHSAHGIVPLTVGALSVDVSHLFIDGMTYFANNFADFGGAFDAYSGSQVTVDGNASFVHHSGVSNGGAIFIDLGCVLNIDGNAYFAHNSAVINGGAVHAENGCGIYMDGNTHFSDNSARFRGGGISMKKSNLTVDGNTALVNNSAAVGGGIYSEYGSLIVSQKGAAWFTGNAATTDGGAIAMTAPSEVQITNITFVSNTAKVGGAISMDSPNDNRRIFDNCFFYGNIGTDGGAISLYGGAGLDYIAHCIFRDNYASNGGAAYIVWDIDLIIADTSFVANQAVLNGMAMFLARLSASSTVEFRNVTFESNAYHCPLGQYSFDVIDESASRFEAVCQGCSTVGGILPDGVRVVSEDRSLSCKDLPGGTVALSSGTTVEDITLQEGYYRTSNESGVVVQCYRSEACLGGNDPANYCADGYAGAYCSLCADGLSRGIAYSCRECSQKARAPAIGVSLIVVVVVSLLAVVILKSIGTAVGDDSEESKGASQGFAGSKCAWCHDMTMKVLPLSAIKIVVVVWQIIYQFSSIAVEVYPKQYDIFVSHLSFTTFDIGVIMWYSCLFSPDFYSRLLLATVTPLVVLSMLAGAYLMAQKKYGNSDHGQLVVRNQHLTAALFVVFFTYSSASSTIFQTFRCDLLDDGVRYLQADYSITCSNTKHKAYTVYASLMLILYPLGIPALFCWWLVRNREHLQMADRETIAHLKPFYSIWGTYKPSRYYYEVVECCRRISLSAASVYFIPNSVNQIAIVLSLALVFMFVSESMSPFDRDADMSLYRWGNGVVLASMYVALLMKANATNEGMGQLSVLAWVLITANVVMIISVMVQSVLLAKEWRRSMIVLDSIPEPIEAATPPIQPEFGQEERRE